LPNVSHVRRVDSFFPRASFLPPAAVFNRPQMPPAKRRRLSDDEHDGTDAASSASDSPHDNAAAASGSDSGSDSPDTDADLAGVRPSKSKKTLKRKHRATDPSRFGATLQFLLATDAPSSLPLSLKPEVARKHNDEKLEGKARKVLKVERKEKEDKCRIHDIVGGWGGEGERGLRKVAQRGGTSFSSIPARSRFLTHRIASSRKTFQCHPADAGCRRDRSGGGQGESRLGQTDASCTCSG
jgi:hypothetical protein